MWICSNFILTVKFFYDIQIHFLEMAFGQPYFLPSMSLHVNCGENFKENKTDWLWISAVDKSVSNAIPSCDYLCESDPIEDKLVYNRTWTAGSLSLGTIATYTCIGM